MVDYLELAAQNQAKAAKIIKDLRIKEIWESVGAEANLVGSMKTGLLMKHRDIDFHIYSKPLIIADSFAAISKLAEDPCVKSISYTNLIDTEEECIEWHAWYQDENNDTWQIDMIHILKGSTYDGFFENIAQRIISVLTPETRNTILKLKYETPEDVRIIGIEYCQAVIQGGVRTFDELLEWKQEQPETGINTWIP